MRTFTNKSCPGIICYVLYPARTPKKGKMGKLSYNPPNLTENNSQTFIPELSTMVTLSGVFADVKWFFLAGVDISRFDRFSNHKWLERRMVLKNFLPIRERWL